MAEGEYKVTEMFEQAVAKYTGSPYAIAVDSCTNALFLCLTYCKVKEYERHIFIPCQTYMSVPCAIIQAGGIVHFTSDKAKGAYLLEPYPIWDSALRFTHNMFVKSTLSTFMCLSFTGPYKHLKLGKGGMILTDSKRAYNWFKKARNSGRNECSYFEDNFEILGWNMYMLPELAAKGLQLIRGFYNPDGSPKDMPDIDVPYPDLSKFKIYTQNG